MCALTQQPSEVESDLVSYLPQKTAQASLLNFPIPPLKPNKIRSSFTAFFSKTLAPSKPGTPKHELEKQTQAKPYTSSSTKYSSLVPKPNRGSQSFLTA